MTVLVPTATFFTRMPLSSQGPGLYETVLLAASTVSYGEPGKSGPSSRYPRLASAVLRHNLVHKLVVVARNLLTATGFFSVPQAVLCDRKILFRFY